MKLQKLNVIYTVENPKEIQYLKNLGFKEVKKQKPVIPPVQMFWKNLHRNNRLSEIF